VRSGALHHWASPDCLAKREQALFGDPQFCVVTQCGEQGGLPSGDRTAAAPAQPRASRAITTLRTVCRRHPLTPCWLTSQRINIAQSLKEAASLLQAQSVRGIKE